MASTVWRGRIAFGLVSIPVRLHKAARRERVKFHHVYRPQEEPAASEPEWEDEPEPEREPVRAPLSKVTTFTPPPAAAAPPPPGEQEDRVERVHHEPSSGAAPVLKGYEIEKGRYVVLEKEEVAALRPRTSSELGILEFVLLSEIDPTFFDTSYYIRPERGGEKPYAILFEALRRSGYVALGTLAMHGREHSAVIRPAGRGLVLHTLFYNNEVRSDEEYAADTNAVSAQEMKLAGMLVDALAAKFEPAKLKDAFEERLRELIDMRAHTAVSSDVPREEPARAPVVDILEALKQSLARMKKPAQTESHGAARVRSSKRTRGAS